MGGEGRAGATGGWVKNRPKGMLVTAIYIYSIADALAAGTRYTTQQQKKQQQLRIEHAAPFAHLVAILALVPAEGPVRHHGWAASQGSQLVQHLRRGGEGRSQVGGRAGRRAGGWMCALAWLQDRKRNQPIHNDSSRA